MNDLQTSFVEKPRARPADPRFSSGPCRKHPGWSLSSLDTHLLGRSHRATEPKARLKLAIDRSAQLIGLPSNWKLGIVPGSDTGAFEMALWSLLGSRPVDALKWESFSNDWVTDLNNLSLTELNVLNADYGLLPDLRQVNASNDIVFVFNGTTSGVCVPDLDWLPEDRQGLVLCDATSAAFALPLDFTKLDVVTWSWQKVLGGEAAHGMLALSPRAVARLETSEPPRSLPKLFTLAKKQQLIDGIFSGATINTPSMLSVEDLHSALDWADRIGGGDALHKRTLANFRTLDQWVTTTDWIEWLAINPDTRSPTSMCLKIVSPTFTSLSAQEQQSGIKNMLGWLAEESVAFDIANYRTAPAGFRIWGGPTVDTSDITNLTAWLDWAYLEFERTLNQRELLND